MTISEIAALAGVSVATVSRTINGSGQVSPKSAKKVMRVIEEHHYVPNVTGRNLRTAKTFRLLVALPTISNPFYSRIVEGIYARAAKYQYNILVAPVQNSRDIERKYLDMLISKQVDGYISFFTHLTGEEITSLSQKYPLVQACEFARGSDTSGVQIDNCAAAREAVAHLIGRGHRRIGMLSGSFYQDSAAQRDLGYRRALKEASLPYDPGYLVKCDYNFQSGLAGCQQLMGLCAPPTAIFCVSDEVAVGAAQYLCRAGLRPGADVEIIGFDNTAVTDMFLPTISSVAQPCFDIGTTAVDLLLEKIEDNACLNKRVILPHKLVLKETAH